MTLLSTEQNGDERLSGRDKFGDRESKIKL